MFMRSVALEREVAHRLSSSLLSQSSFIYLFLFLFLNVYEQWEISVLGSRKIYKNVRKKSCTKIDFYV